MIRELEYLAAMKEHCFKPSMSSPLCILIFFCYLLFAIHADFRGPKSSLNSSGILCAIILTLVLSVPQVSIMIWKMFILLL